MNDRDRIVAVGLLTESDLSVLGQGFRRLYRLDDDQGFQHLLEAIDRAEQDYQSRQSNSTMNRTNRVSG